MIIFVSGRCDIPAFYSEWFFKRLQEGFVDVRNPFNPHQISRIPLNEQNVDAFLFCTKNPTPLLQHLDAITIPSLFHITLTSYHEDIEPHVPDKKMIIQAIKELSKQVGKERVVLRYDPILLSDRYTCEYHRKAFASLLEQLQDAISLVIISFVDLYKNTKANYQSMHLKEMDEQDMREIGKVLGEIATQYHMPIQTCAEVIDLSDVGIQQGACVSKEIMEGLLQRPYEPSKGKTPRTCKCLPFVDIGDYNACAHLCKYCYANYNEKEVRARMLRHDPNSSVLLGHITEEDKITIRKEKGYQQLPLL